MNNNYTIEKELLKKERRKLSTIIDKVEDGIVEFHIDPKKYRELKELNYQVKTTNVELRYLKLHP